MWEVPIPQNGALMKREREGGGTKERIFGLRFNYFELPTKKKDSLPFTLTHSDKGLLFAALNLEHS